MSELKEASLRMIRLPLTSAKPKIKEASLRTIRLPLFWAARGAGGQLKEVVNHGKGSPITNDAASHLNISEYNLKLYQVIPNALARESRPP